MVCKQRLVLEIALCRLAIILVDEATEHIPSLDWAMPRALIKWERHLLPYSLMWARLIVVRDIGGQDLAQMRLVDDEYVAEAFPARSDVLAV